MRSAGCNPVLSLRCDPSHSKLLNCMFSSSWALASRRNRHHVIGPCAALAYGRLLLTPTMHASCRAALAMHCEPPKPTATALTHGELACRPPTSHELRRLLRPLRVQRTPLHPPPLRTSALAQPRCRCHCCCSCMLPRPSSAHRAVGQLAVTALPAPAGTVAAAVTDAARSLPCFALTHQQSWMM